jgi:hypothetical protein
MTKDQPFECSVWTTARAAMLRGKGHHCEVDFQYASGQKSRGDAISRRTP